MSFEESLTHRLFPFIPEHRKGLKFTELQALVLSYIID